MAKSLQSEISDLHKCELLSDFSKSNLALLVPLIEQVEFQKGEFVIKEGEASTDLYIVKEGKLEVVKKEGETQHRLALCGPHDFFGEMSFLDRSFRSASVRALERVVLYRLTVSRLDVLSSHKGSYSKIALTIAKKVTRRLRCANEMSAKALQSKLDFAKTRGLMSDFIIHVLMVLSVYSFIAKAFNIFGLNVRYEGVFSAWILVILATIVLIVMKQSQYPLSFYGLTTKNWKVSLFEGIVFSIPFIGLVTLAKWIFIHTVPAYYNEPLFNFFAEIHRIHTESDAFIFIPAIYLLFTPIQELICRGGLQSSMQVFLTSPHRKTWAIFISNLLFATFHLHFALSFAVAAFFGGLFWGWMYARHKCLIGVCVSHFLIGGFVFYVVDIGHILAV